MVELIHYENLEYIQVCVCVYNTTMVPFRYRMRDSGRGSNRQQNIQKKQKNKKTRKSHVGDDKRSYLCSEFDKQGVLRGPQTRTMIVGRLRPQLGEGEASTVSQSALSGDERKFGEESRALGV